MPHHPLPPVDVSLVASSPGRTDDRTDRPSVTTLWWMDHRHHLLRSFVRSNGVLVFFVFFYVVEGQVDGCFEGVRKTDALAARVLLRDEETASGAAAAERRDG